MRLALLTLVATVVLPGGVDAQEAVWCGRESGRTIRGHVADSAGLPVDSAVAGREAEGRRRDSPAGLR